MRANEGIAPAFADQSGASYPLEVGCASFARGEDFNKSITQLQLATSLFQVIRFL
jgi:hypothetical protein